MLAVAIGVRGARSPHAGGVRDRSRCLPTDGPLVTVADPRRRSRGGEHSRGDVAALSVDVTFRDADVVLYRGDALEALRELEDGAADACITSPPYLDARPEYPSPTEAEFGAIFRELRRVVTGTLLVNVGRLFRDNVESLWWLELLEAARRAEWLHRDTLVWIKPNANPILGAVLANSHEYVFLFGDGFDTDAVRTEYMPGSIARLRRRHLSHVGVKGDGNGATSSRHDRSSSRGERHEPNADGARARSFMVASVGKEKGNTHPAPMPLELAEYLVALSGGSTIIDPFAGSGTTLLAARNLSRRAIGVELDADYCDLIAARLAQQTLFVEELGVGDPDSWDHLGSPTLFGLVEE